MAALINWATIGQVALESLSAGVVVVGAVALGARMLASAGIDAETGTSTTVPGRVPKLALAVVCFLVALAAIGYGIYFTIDK